MAFGQIWLGSNALIDQQIFIDTVSNNIANVNTVGFKRSQTTFRELFARTLVPAQEESGNRGGINPSQQGFGILEPAIARDLRQGSLMDSNIPTNLAIVGEGYFILRNVDSPRDGEFLYSRAGDFVIDRDMNLVNASNGLFVQGFVSTFNVATGRYEIQTGTVGNISNLPNTIPGQATTQIDLRGNLDAEASLAVDPITVTYDKSSAILSNRTFANPATVIVPNPNPVRSSGSLAALTDEVLASTKKVPETLSIRYSDNKLESFTVNPGDTLQDLVNNINAQSTDVVASAFLDTTNNRYYLQLDPADPNTRAVEDVFDIPAIFGSFSSGFTPGESETLRLNFSNGVTGEVIIPPNTTLQGLVDLINDPVQGIPFVRADLVTVGTESQLRITPFDPTIGIVSVGKFPKAFSGKFDDPNTSTVDESLPAGFTSGITSNTVEFRFKRVHPTENIFRYEAFDNTGTQVTVDDDGLAIAGLIKLDNNGKVVAHYQDTTGSDEMIDISGSEVPGDNDRFGVVNPTKTSDGYDFYTINGIDIVIPNGVTKTFNPDQSTQLTPEDFTIKAKTDEGLNDSALSANVFSLTSDDVTNGQAGTFTVTLTGQSQQSIAVPAGTTVQGLVTLINDPINGISGITASTVTTGTQVQIKLTADTAGDSFGIVETPLGLSDGFVFELGNLGVEGTSVAGKAELKEGTDYIVGFSKTVFDSLGNSHDVTFQYQRLEQNKWLYSISPQYTETEATVTIGDNSSGGGTTLDGLTLGQGDLKLTDLENGLYDVQLTIDEGNGEVVFTQVGSAFSSTGTGTEMFRVTDPATGAIALSRDIAAGSAIKVTYRRSVPEGYGILAFDQNGLYDAANSTVLKTLGWTPEGAAALSITLNYTNTNGDIQVIQNGGESNIEVESLDGLPPGTLLSTNFGEKGKLMGLFSNGRTEVLAQVALQEFINPRSLEAVGESMFKDTINTGKKATVSLPGEGAAGEVLGGKLESSNVSISREFVDLIRAQRGFQSNSRVVRASDEMIRTALDLKR